MYQKRIKSLQDQTLTTLTGDSYFLLKGEVANLKFRSAKEYQGYLNLGVIKEAEYNDVEGKIIPVIHCSDEFEEEVSSNDVPILYYDELGNEIPLCSDCFNGSNQ